MISWVVGAFRAFDFWLNAVIYQWVERLEMLFTEFIGVSPSWTSTFLLLVIVHHFDLITLWHLRPPVRFHRLFYDEAFGAGYG